MINDSDLSDLLARSVKKYGAVTAIPVFNDVVNKYFLKNSAILHYLARQNLDSRPWYDRRRQVLERYASLYYGVGRNEE